VDHFSCRPTIQTRFSGAKIFFFLIWFW
jgi:hypothetical protein